MLHPEDGDSHASWGGANHGQWFTADSTGPVHDHTAMGTASCTSPPLRQPRFHPLILFFPCGSAPLNRLRINSEIPHSNPEFSKISRL